MSKLKLNITDRAKEDISLITDYIAKDNKKAAKMLAEYFYRVCSNLADFPHLGTVRSDFSYKDYRFYVVKKRFIIAYRIEGNNLFISRVLSDYQDICYLLL